jgi:hypothetical protein
VLLVADFYIRAELAEPVDCFAGGLVGAGNDCLMLEHKHRQAAHTDAADAYEMKPFARKSVKSVRYHFPSSFGPCRRLMYPYVCPEHISSLKATYIYFYRRERGDHRENI